MEKKMMIAEFAALVGTTSKTIYQKISKFDELPVDERLMTVKEKVKGREVTLIITNTDQINFYKNLYGKNTVNDGEYYETLTENNSKIPVAEIQEPVKTFNNNQISPNIIEQILTVNNEWNNRYEQKINELISVTNKLSEVKEHQLLLEEKAGREGLYLNEINELKTDNKAYKKSNERLRYVIVTLIMVIVGFIMYFIMVNNISQPVNNPSEPVTNVQEQIDTKKTAESQEVVTPPTPQPAQKVSNPRKK